MKQVIEKITFKTEPEEYINITNKIYEVIKQSNLSEGLLNLSILHTSCSLLVQENADNTVLFDIKDFLNEIAPKRNYLHNTEGSDDMPAHLKSLITQSNITLSVKQKNLVIGRWQGIFLLEHRNHSKKRNVLFHFMGV